MWQFLALLTALASPMEFTRRMREKLESTDMRLVSAWAERPQLDVAYFGTPRCLDIDIWRHQREYLDEDVWAWERAGLTQDQIKMVPRGVPERREYILERLDGGHGLK